MASTADTVTRKARTHEPGQAVVGSVPPEGIEWQPFPTGPLGLDYLDPDDAPRSQ